MKSDSQPDARVLDVVCAVLVDGNDHVMAVQRPAGGALGGMWEFPGGKIEPGESEWHALRRELLEELVLDLSSLGEPVALGAVTHAYDFATIRLSAHLVRCQDRPKVRLLEHVDLVWLPVGDARRLQWAAADVPILQALERVMTEPPVGKKR